MSVLHFRCYKKTLFKRGSPSQNTLANCRDKIYFLKAFGTFYIVLTEMFFKQPLNTYAEE